VAETSDEVRKAKLTLVELDEEEQKPGSSAPLIPPDPGA
jgi:hypothetical protein